MLRIRIAITFGLLTFCSFAFGHAFEFTEADVVIFADGSVQATIPFHIDALIAGVPMGDPSEEDYARIREMPTEQFDKRFEDVTGYLRTSVRLKFNDVAVEPTIRFPEREKLIAAGKTRNALPGEFFVLETTRPADAETFVYTASPIYRMTHLRVFDEAAHGLETAAHQEPVNPGELSTPYVIGRAYEAPPVLTVARQYVQLGILHIVPRGLDHILFVLGLFLLSAKFRPLAWQITAFTVAHTLTLALAAADIVALPAKPVEILIAASIAFVAIENLLTEELHWWRPVTVFLFGLLHGLGFAGVLGEIGLPQDRFLTGLLSFNIGVEIAQLAIVALAFVIVARFREAAAYRKVVVVPGSLLIASVGIYMAVERAIS